MTSMNEAIIMDTLEDEGESRELSELPSTLVASHGSSFHNRRHNHIHICSIVPQLRIAKI